MKEFEKILNRMKAIHIEEISKIMKKKTFTKEERIKAIRKTFMKSDKELMKAFLEEMNRIDKKDLTDEVTEETIYRKDDKGYHCTAIVPEDKLEGFFEKLKKIYKVK